MSSALSPTMTGFLPSRSASALTSSKTSSAGVKVLMNYTKRRVGAGVKKCKATSRLGQDAAAANSGSERA